MDAYEYARENIGGEKPVAGPQTPPPVGSQAPTQPLIAEKIPTLVITYQATGKVFEGSLQGATLTAENFYNLIRDVETIAAIEPSYEPEEAFDWEVIKDFGEDFDAPYDDYSDPEPYEDADEETDDEWSEGYEAGYKDAEADARIEALIEVSNEPVNLLFPEMFLEVGDKVHYKGECIYNKDMPLPWMVGTVVSVEDWEDELLIGVTFLGWHGGHPGDGSYGTTYYNFWFDMKTGKSREGQLVKVGH